MLLGGRAIFGSLNFRDDRAAHPGFTAAEAQARARGFHTTTWVMDRLHLGLALRAAEPPAPSLPGAPPPTLLSGEIFNHVDVARQLSVGDGFEKPPAALFRHAFEAWGPDALARVDGAFAVAWWDPQARRLILGCDRRGDAHLYYAADARGLVFSSWCELLRPLADGVDRSAVQEFLRFLYISPPRTVYSGIRRLEPGHYLAAADRLGSPQQPSVQPLPWAQAELARRSSGEVVEMFEDLLLTSVGRCIAARPAAVSLSSGVDSSTIAAACARASSSPLCAFTVGFPDAQLDETGQAAAVARHLGIPHHVVGFPLADYRRAVDTLAHGFEAPVADPAFIPLVLAYEQARELAEVFVDGTGSDGLFGEPIPRHLRIQFAVSARLPRGARALLASLLRQVPGRRLGGYAELLDIEDIEEQFITWKGWTRREQEALFQEPVSFDDTLFYRTFRGVIARGAQAVYDAVHFMPPYHERLQAAAMVGRPIHFPYHEPLLRAFVRALPTPWRMDKGQTKVLLRKLHSRYFPDALARVSKHHFNMPLDSLLGYRDFDLVHTYLAHDRIRHHGLIDPALVSPWIERYLRGDTSLRFKIWSLVVLHAWLDGREPIAQPEVARAAR
jgi:asparagine synthase (glutamine-hydrolysing)